MPISSALGSSALLPGGLGFRNVLINGDFRINQRGFSSTTTDSTYGFDRWKMNNLGGTCTYSAQAFTLGNAIADQEPTNFARILTTGQSASNHFAMLRQIIEDVRTFAGQTVTVSFWAKAASGTPQVALELEQNFGIGGSPSSAVTKYAGSVTLSTSWQRFVITTTMPSISGKTIGTTANTSNVLCSFFVSAGSDWNSRTGSIGIQSNTFDFWGIQAEQNYQVTPFEQRPIGVELSLCQRYYQVWTSNATGTAICVGFSDGAGTAGSMNRPIVPNMRVAPTNSFSGVIYATDFSVYRQLTALTSDRNTADTFTTQPSYSGGTLNANRAAYIYGTGGSIILSAEL